MEWLYYSITYGLKEGYHQYLINTLLQAGLGITAFIVIVILMIIFGKKNGH